MSILNTLRQKNPNLRDSSDDDIKSLIRKSPEFSTFSDSQFERYVTGNYGGPGGKSATEEGGSPGFMGGLSAGVDQVQAMGGGLLQAAGDALGSDTVWDAGKDMYQRNMEEAGENSLGYGFTDITGPMEAFNWARYTAGNLAPTLAVSIAGGGIGGVAGRLLAGSVAKQTAIKAGQGFGAYAASAGMETGLIMGQTEELDVSLAHGSLAGAMDALTPFLLLRKMGAGDVADRATSEISGRVLNDLTRTAGRSRGRAAGRGSLTGLIVESSTEGLQGLIGQHANYWVETNGESLLQNLGEVNYKHIIDEMAAGGLMGAGLGPIAGVTERNRAQTQVERIEAARRQSESDGGDALDQLRAAQEAEREGPLFEDGPFDPDDATPDAPLFDDGPFEDALPPGLRESDRGQPLFEDGPFDDEQSAADAGQSTTGQPPVNEDGTTGPPAPPAEGVPVIQRGPDRGQPMVDDFPDLPPPPADGVPVLDRGPRGASPTQDGTTGFAADDLSPFQRNQLRDYGMTDEQLGSVSTEQALAELDAANRQSQRPQSDMTEEGTGVFRVPTDQIQVDPEQYQFRTKVDKKGVDRRLNAVEKWDENKAGDLIVHRRNDGSLFIADGHHRLDLAKRLGQPAVNARILEESQGFDVPAARAEAAMNNIADGKAEPLDAAKVFRDIDLPNAEIRKQNNLPDNQVVRDGEALANLSDNAFGMVAAGQLSEKDGAAIGANFSDSGEQEAAAKAFQNGAPKSGFERQLMVNEIKAAGFAQSQGDQGGLFGDDPEEISLLQSRLSVLNSLRQDLTFDKNLFASLNKNAGRAGEAGNSIATEANQDITDESAKALDMINRVSTNPTLSEMVNRAARRVADGEKKAPVVRDLKKELQSYEAGQDQPRVNGQSSPRPADSPSEQPPVSEGVDPGAGEPVPEADADGSDQVRELEGATEEVAPSLDLVEESDPIQQTKANIAGMGEAEASLTILRDALELGTDSMNDGQLPDSIRKQAIDLADRITEAVEDGSNLDAITREAAETLNEWDKAGDSEPELRAIQRKLEAFAGIEAPQSEPGLELESQTEGDLSRRDRVRQQAEKAQADARKKEDDRIRADEQVNDFNLTGSDSPTDQAEAAGQGNMFDESADPAPVTTSDLQVKEVKPMEGLPNMRPVEVTQNIEGNRTKILEANISQARNGVGERLQFHPLRLLDIDLSKTDSYMRIYRVMPEATDSQAAIEKAVQFARDNNLDAVMIDTTTLDNDREKLITDDVLGQLGFQRLRPNKQGDKKWGMRLEGAPVIDRPDNTTLNSDARDLYGTAAPSRQLSAYADDQEAEVRERPSFASGPTKSPMYGPDRRGEGEARKKAVELAKDGGSQAVVKLYSGLGGKAAGHLVVPALDSQAAMEELFSQSMSTGRGGDISTDLVEIIPGENVPESTNPVQDFVDGKRDDVPTFDEVDAADNRPIRDEPAEADPEAVFEDYARQIRRKQDYELANNELYDEILQNFTLSDGRAEELVGRLETKVSGSRNEDQISRKRRFFRRVEAINEAETVKQVNQQIALEKEDQPLPSGITDDYTSRMMNRAKIAQRRIKDNEAADPDPTSVPDEPDQQPETSGLSGIRQVGKMSGQKGMRRIAPSYLTGEQSVAWLEGYDSASAEGEAKPKNLDDEISNISSEDLSSLFDDVVSDEKPSEPVSEPEPGTEPTTKTPNDATNTPRAEKTDEQKTQDREKRQRATIQKNRNSGQLTRANGQSFRTKSGAADQLKRWNLQNTHYIYGKKGEGFTIKSLPEIGQDNARSVGWLGDNNSFYLYGFNQGNVDAINAWVDGKIVNFKPEFDGGDGGQVSPSAPLTKPEAGQKVIKIENPDQAMRRLQAAGMEMNARLPYLNDDYPDILPQERSAAEIAKSFGSNLTSAGVESLKALENLFGGPGRLGSGLQFDEDTYARAKPHFKKMLEDSRAAGDDLRAFIRKIVSYLGLGSKPYVMRFVEELQSEQVKTTDNAEPDSAPATNPESDYAPKPGTLARKLYDRLDEITDNRKLKAVIAEHFDVSAKEVTDQQMKQAQEALELALVTRARDIVQRDSTRTDRAVFDELQAMYAAQPNLNVRSSGSMQRQAYSTPAPLAFLASRLSGITEATTVYEPTAGNGMLLIGAPADNIVANELDAERAELLEAQGIEVSQEDATTFIPADQVDSVIMNPPFGRLKDEAGKPQPVKIDGYTIKAIDHLIAAKALEAMQDDGQATMIIGASKLAGDIAAADRTFFNWLYRNYNVTSHFEVDGDLYNRQGAGWPVRVITIKGRQASNRVSPKSGVIERANNWSEVYAQYERGLAAQQSDGSRTEDTGGTDKPDATDGPVPTEAVSGEQNRPDGDGRGNDGRGGALDPDNGSRPGDRDRTGDGDSTDGRGGVTGGQSEPADIGVGSEQQAGNNTQGPGVTGTTDTGGLGGQSTAGKPGKLSKSEFQTPYNAKSKGKNDAVLTPNNMALPLEQALTDLENEVGDLDTYVQEKLGYDTVAEMHESFMGLQVDAVAAAIYNIENNKGIIIADQTGVGKGRQAAAIIRYARRVGKTPVFMSVTPNLFSDMYGDLQDIGDFDVKPFIVNSAERITYKEREVYKSEGGKRHKSQLQAMAATGKMPGDADTLFLTYSQIQKDNLQRQVMSKMAENAIFVLDEAHNVSGNRSTSIPASKGGGEKLTGAGFMFSLINEKPVAYLSATYAKRPDNMPLYYRTDLSKAVDEIDQLAEAVSQGGLQLQAVISNMLARAGQLFRRERSFEGIKITTSIDTDNTAAHEKLSDQVAEGLSAINRADKMFHNVAMEGIKEAAEESGGGAKGAGNRAGNVDHMNFSSVIHNYIGQLLLGLKVERSASQAIELHRKGVKPVIALENTMESFLSEYVNDMGIQVGDPVEANYNDVLLRALERSRRYSRELPNGDKEAVQVSLSELDPATREAYQEAQKVIKQLDIADIPMSPIDLMRYRMTQAGMKPSEITGRNMTLDYSTNPPTLAKRDPTERTDKRATVDAFNTGRLDALVLNVSGSTGLSIHASENFKDQKPRHMIVAQAPKDINILMQMLGRINRTGQVVKPEFTMMGLNIPSEKRPLAVTSKKMKSLNANTSANDKSDTSVEAPDILNKYGDQVVAEYLSANPELATELDLGFTASPDGEAESRPTEGLAMKFTGRLARTPVETQKLAYEEIESAFSQLIEYLTKTGQNDLDPQTVDLDARIMASKVVYEGKDPTSLFGGNTTLHKVDAKYQGKPPTGKDVQSALDETLKGGKTPKQIADELILDLADHPGRSATIERALERVDATEAAIQKAAKEDGLEGGEPAEILEQSKLRDDSELSKKYLDLEGNYQSAVSKAKLTQARLDDTRKRTNEALESTFKIGDHVMLDLSDEVVTGVVTGIKTNLKGKGGDAYALSKTRVSFMVNSGIRNIELPLSKLRPSSGIFIQKLSTKAPLDDIFKGQGDLGGEMREQRFIATGNLIAASADRSIPGRIVSFTSQDGNTYQGMMLPRWFKDSSFEDAGSGQYMALRDKAPLSKFLRNNTDALRRAGGVFDKNQIVRMLPKTDGKWTITVPKANKEELARRVKFSQPLISAMGMEFFGSGKTMTATFEPNRLSAVTEALSELVQLNALPSMRKQWVAAGGKKEAEAVESFDDSPAQGSGDAPAFLRNQGATGTGLSEPQVQATVDRFLKTYPGADNVTVEIHQSATALPGFKADRDSAGASIAGEYVSRTDTVHLVSAAFTNESDVLKALQEEILVHKGLGFFSPQDREQLYRDIQTAAGESQEVKALWDKTVKEYQAVAESAGLNDEQANRLYAEEMLGSLAQEQPSWMKKGWRKLWRGIKRLLVKAGWVDQGIGTAELRERITTISDAFKRGRQAPRRDFSADIRGGTTSQSQVESFSREDGQPPLPQVEVEEDTNEAEAQRIFEEYQAARQNQSGQRESGRENNGRAVGGRNAAADYESKTKIRRRSDSGSEPAVIFRGSRTGGLKPDDFNESSFGVSTGRPSSGLGVFFSSRKREAAGYGDVETFVLDMRKPYVIDGGDLPSFNSTAEATRYRNAIKAKGYDGIVVDYRSIGGQLHYIPFQPEQAIPTESKTRFSLNSAPAPSRDVLAADISKGLANVAELAGARVIQSPGDLPATAKAEMKSLGVDESSVRGLYVDGELFVVADNLRSTQEGIEVAVHEAVGHKGVRGVLGAELDSAMLRLYRTLPNTPQGRAALAEVKAEYRFLDTSKREDRIQIAEEMVAHLLEKGHRPKAWQRVVAKIRELLRKLIPSIAWTYTDVLALGEQSREHLRKRKAGTGDAALRYSIMSRERISGGNLFDDFTDADRAAAAKQGPRSAPRRVMDYWKEATNNAGLKIRQGMVDRLASLKAIDEKLLGEKMLGEDITRSSWVLGRMANAANGALHTMLHTGRIKMDAKQKVIDIQEGDSKGLGAVFAQLASQNDPDSASKEVQRFMGWIAGNRARKLLDEGRENLFTEEDITAMESWDRGVLADGRNRAEAYASVFQEFQAYRDDVLAIADQAGLLRKAMDPDDATLFMANKHGIRSDLADKAKAARKAAARADDIDVKEMAEERESAAIGELQQELVAELGMADYDSEYDMLTTDQRDLWANEFYVPFYRIAEDDNKPTGQLATSGLSRQKAYTRLKGGSQNVNDLLENTMMNFHHLLDASLKNQAAKQAIDNAMDLGIATPVKASNRNEKTSTFVLIDGEKSFYQIDDPLVFESITALSSAGMNNMAMKVMRGFKRLFTNMTTTTPQFMVANLIRDSLQATATNDVSKNAFANVIGGARSYRDQKIKAQMMASGASFNFGHLFGSNPDELRAQLTRDMRGAKLIDGPLGVPDALRKSWEWWNNVNNATENLNRAAIFTQNQDKGKLKAAFESRDLIDFSAHGAWSAIRILIDVVPFLNARIQGLDKIYRSGFKPGYNVLKSVFGGDDANVSDKQSAGRFWAVTGALAMATMMLYLHNQDDEEYQKLEDWQKDTYWFFRIGDQAFFIPKPFEVGAIATMVERITQQFVDDKATGKLFRERMQHMLTDTFAITIVPQAMQPALDVYANYDAFTQRPIESMGMDRLSPELRKRASTSKAGEWISQGLNATVGALGDPELNPLALSPVQVDHLISGYFGQVGTWAASSGDIAWRVASGHEDPARRWYEYQPVRRFYKNLGDEDRYTKYGTVFYEGLREAGRAYADVKELRELGRLEEAAKAVQDNRQMLMIRRSLNRAQSKLRDINKQIDVIRRADMDGELKRQKLDRLRAIKNKIQKVMSTRVMEARG
jgi:hypothetical protein